jgi:DNA-binding NtrC family response regulator
MKTDSDALNVTKPKVLIAEPSYYVAQAYSKELTKLGYDIRFHTTAEQAVREYKKESGLSDTCPFLVVIVDEEIPPRGELAIREILSIVPDQKILYTIKRRQIFPYEKHSIIEVIEKPFSINLLISKLEEAKFGLYN